MFPPHSSNRSGRIALDLVVASAIFIGCWGGIYELSKALRRADSRKHTVLSAIPTGSRRSLILSRGRCVGDISTQATDAAIPSLSIAVHLRTTAHGTPSPITAVITGAFNPLRQLTRGEATLTGAGLSAHITAADVTPITVQASGHLGELRKSIQFTLPGPVLLRRNADDTVGIDYAALPPSLSGGSIAPVIRELTSELGLAIEPSADHNDLCPPSHYDALDLTPILNRITPWMGAAESLEHPFGP